MPQEVSAVIGIDTTIPAAGAGPVGTHGLPFNVGRLLRTIGVVRAAITIAPSLAAPQGGAYTADERAQNATMPNWVQLHENQLHSVQHHEVVVLDGGHYLHWTQSQAMAEKITAFLGANLGRP